MVFVYEHKSIKMFYCRLCFPWFTVIGLSEKDFMQFKTYFDKLNWNGEL